MIFRRRQRSEPSTEAGLGLSLAELGFSSADARAAVATMKLTGRREGLAIGTNLRVPVETSSKAIPTPPLTTG